MKKLYLHPNIKILALNVEVCEFITDSIGDPDGSNFNAREEKYFDEDDDNDPKKSFWDE